MEGIREARAIIMNCLYGEILQRFADLGSHGIRVDSAFLTAYARRTLNAEQRPQR